MAKIDTGSIAGFEAMSDADKVTALLGLDIPEDMTGENNRLKTLVDRYSTEIAKAKRESRANTGGASEDRTQTDGASEDGGGDGELEALRKQVTQLQRERDIASLSGSLTAQLQVGADKAKALAEAMTDGETAKMLTLLSDHQTARDKERDRDAASKSPKLGGGGGQSGEGGDEAVEFAKRIGSARAKAAEDGNNIIDKYIRR